MTGAGGTLLLGVRHHGPGSARAVWAALDEARPDAVLVEGPPEADPLVRLAGDEGMRPPVALLAHVVDEPGRSAFWPLAEFSPEWVAIRWAVERDVPVRFIDLPAAHSLARAEKPAESDESDESDEPDVPEGGDVLEGSDVPEEGEDAVRIDPIAVLAETAGYDDPERWWEDVVEHREAGGDAFAPFEAVSDAMEALREVYGDGGHSRDLVREAHMRLRMRAAQKEFGPDRVAVVCGAWHVPALRRKATVAADRALLKGLPKVKAEMTWVPWTHRRLSRASGYGAGIASPGWYGHLFAAADRPLERWMTKVAGLLRDEDRLVSSAHVIEAVRLAEALAAMRGRPLAGLSETTDAVRAVMCEGSDVPLALVHDRLVVGDVLGEVPESAPAVPLQRDLTRAQRRLRLKPEALEREVELDLRKETDAARSTLLHRLRLLGVDWGRPERSRGSTGTFRETWRLRWEPELSVRVAEAGVWGTTVLGAASGKASADAVGAAGLADVTALAERCLLAELPEALPVVMRVLADRAALDADVGHLAQALPALVRSLRYGDVRGTDTGALGEVALGLAERVFVGLPGACVGLGTDAALEMRGHVDAVHQAVGLLGEFRGGSAERGRERHGAAGAPAAPGGMLAGGARGGGSAALGGEGSGGMPADGARGEGAAAPGGEGPHGIGADDGRGEGATAPGGEGPHGIPADGAQGRGPAVPGRDRVHGMRARWGSVLRVIARRDTVAGVVRGRCVRLLLDGGELAGDEVARLMGLALSRGSEPAEAAAWIEGFVGGGSGGGMLLVHDERLLGLVDDWLSGVSDDAFIDVLPLLRRTFSAYEPGVRRTLGELVRRGTPGAGPVVGGGGVPGFGEVVDAARADAAVPTVRLLLGMAQRESDDTVGVAG
ncbi:DUF5682 family protein [Streptomyces sp. KN37]|uniref:DUF5682 family protein n=1 Tax=Streptomyces sp. KN37 TaxID=3090667 RepID=UPI002A748A23|nr:DUF5682 family protein [Streptomyces sp. KN37]WPO71938.1 DUF5682 family protein [Streptomyces sp. KN37]